VLQTLLETATLCKEKKNAEKQTNDAKAWVEEIGEVQSALSDDIRGRLGCIGLGLFYLIPMLCVLTLPVVSSAHGYEFNSVGSKWFGAVLWPLFGLFSLLGVLVGVEGAEAIVGKIFVGLLIAAGIWVVGWAAMKREEASLDARKREKNDRSRKVSEAGSALSAIERSIREKDRKMKEIFESLSVKESVSSSRAGDLGEE
jgi:hypothetical protein